MKKYIITCLGMLVALCSFGQNQAYQVTVKLNNIQASAKAYMVTQYGWSDSKVIDSVNLKDKEFIFKGNTTEPFKTHIVIKHNGKGGADWHKNNDALLVYVESGNTMISGADSIVHAMISGSKINSEYSSYHTKVLFPFERIEDEVNTAFASADAEKKKDKAYQAGLMAKMKTASKMVDSLKYEYIKANPASYLSLEALIELAGNHPNTVIIEPFFKNLDAGLQGSPQGKKLAEALYDNGPTGIGAIAPVFAENDVNGKLVKLTDFRGKYVLLDFWASWCGPCRAENPNVLKAYHQYKDKNFTVLGVSLDQPGKKDAWLAAIKHDELPWTQVSDLQFWNNVAAKLYNIRAIPQNFLIDPSGKIVAKNLRGDALEATLSKFIH